MATRVGRVDVITSLEGAEDLEPEWEDMAARFGRTPFCLPALALGWWRHVGRGELLIVAARSRSGELLAVAPLHQRSLGGVRVARWLGTGLGSVAEVVLHPDSPAAAAAIWEALRERVQLLDLLECRLDSRGLLELRRSSGWASRLRVADLCPTVELGSVASVDELLAGRPNLRKKFAHYDRAVAATGHRFETEVVNDPQRFAEVLADIVEIYDAAEAAKPRAHLLAGRWRPFTVDALDTAARRSRLVVFIGRLGSRPIAFDLTIRIGTTLATWAGRYHPDAARLRPGHLLMREIVRWSIDHRIETLDLLLGDADYKRRWSTSSYDTVDVVAGPPRWTTGAALLLDTARAIHPIHERLRALVRAPQAPKGAERWA